MSMVSNIQFHHLTTCPCSLGAQITVSSYSCHIYVGDMMIIGDDIQGIQELKKILGQHFEMKDFGTP